MTPEEKWRRLKNPTCAADYGLGLTEEELRSFPEGRAFLVQVRLYQRAQANADRLQRKVGRSIAEAVARVRDELILTTLAQCPKDGPN